MHSTSIKYEVTNAQFARFLNTLRRNNSTDGYGWIDLRSLACLTEKASGTNRARSGFESHPVGLVSWYGARDYAEFVGKRLPTEAEWGKATRGGQEGMTYPWGSHNGKGMANYDQAGGRPRQNRVTGGVGFDLEISGEVSGRRYRLGKPIQTKGKQGGGVQLSFKVRPDRTVYDVRIKPGRRTTVGEVRLKEQARRYIERIRFDTLPKNVPQVDQSGEIFINFTTPRFRKPVGSYPANGYGLYDMGGNVAKWCADVYDSVSSSENRVLHGGFWLDAQEKLRCASRVPGVPHGMSMDIGFRCAKDAKNQ